LIAANAAILLTAYAVGTVRSGTYGFGCFYENMSMGAACDPSKITRLFWESFVLVALAIYALWVVTVLAWRFFKKAE
jgi:hypothetical protein